MLRILAIGIGLLAVTAGPAGSSATVRPAPAVCVAKLTNGTPRVVRTDAILLLRPTHRRHGHLDRQVEFVCHDPARTGRGLRDRLMDRPLSLHGSARGGRTDGGTMTWYGKASGTVTCRRDRANVGPDIPGTPLSQRFHRAGSFAIGQATVAAAARGPLMIVTADGDVTRAASDRALATCGPLVLGSNDPTLLGKPVSPGALVRKGTVRATVRQQGTVGIVAALVGGPVRGSVSVTFAIAFRG